MGDINISILSPAINFFFTESFKHFFSNKLSLFIIFCLIILLILIYFFYRRGLKQPCLAIEKYEKIPMINQQLKQPQGYIFEAKINNKKNLTVKVHFNSKVSQDFFEDFFKFMNSNKYICHHRSIIRNWGNQEISIETSITREELQELINEANSHALRNF